MVIKAIAYGCIEVGKVMKSSKKRFFWKFSIDGVDNTVEIVSSKLSGKKKLYHNTQLIYEGKKKIGSFQFPFQIDVNMCTVMHKGEGFELKINNHSFESLCDEHTKTEFTAEEKAGLIKRHKDLKKKEGDHAVPASARGNSKGNLDVGSAKKTGKNGSMPDLDEGYGKTVATDFKFEYPTSQQPKKTTQAAAPSNPAKNYFDLPPALRGERAATHIQTTQPQKEHIPVTKIQTHEAPKQPAQNSSNQNDPFAVFGDFSNFNFPSTQNTTTTTTTNQNNNNNFDFLNFNQPSTTNQQNNFNQNNFNQNNNNGGFNNFNNFGAMPNQNQANMAMGFGNQQNNFNNMGNPNGFGNFNNQNNNMDFFNAAPMNNESPGMIPNVPISLDVDPKPKQKEKEKAKTSPKPETKVVKEIREPEKPKEQPPKEVKETKSSKETKNSKVNNNTNVHKAYENKDPNQMQTTDNSANTSASSTTKPHASTYSPGNLSSMLGLTGLSGLRGERGPKKEKEEIASDQRGGHFNVYGNNI